MYLCMFVSIYLEHCEFTPVLRILIPHYMGHLKFFPFHICSYLQYIYLPVSCHQYWPHLSFSCNTKTLSSPSLRYYYHFLQWRWLSYLTWGFDNLHQATLPPRTGSPGLRQTADITTLRLHGYPLHLVLALTVRAGWIPLRYQDPSSFYLAPIPFPRLLLLLRPTGALSSFCSGSDSPCHAAKHHLDGCPLQSAWASTTHAGMLSPNHTTRPHLMVFCLNCSRSKGSMKKQGRKKCGKEVFTFWDFYKSSFF